MTPFNILPHEKELGLGALKQMVLKKGEFSPKEHKMLQAAAQFLDCDENIDDLPTQSPEMLVKHFGEGPKRRRMIQALMTMALMDGKVTQGELDFIDETSARFGIKEPRRFQLGLLSKGHNKLVRFTLPMMGGMFAPKMREAWRRGGFDGVYHLLGFAMGWHKNAMMEAKYRELGDYPEGSLGKAYFDHMIHKGFAFPGAKKSFPEVFVPHDLSHILAGFDTDCTGEVEAVAFIAGYLGADPFWYLFMILVHMHLGLEVFIGDPVGLQEADPHRMLSALKRGMMVNQDLYDDWDFWQDFSLDVQEVRSKYNILAA